MQLPHGLVHPPVEGIHLLSFLKVGATLNPQRHFPAVNSVSRPHQKLRGAAPDRLGGLAALLSVLLPYFGPLGCDNPELSQPSSDF